MTLKPMDENNTHIIKELRGGGNQALTCIFRTYNRPLLYFAKQIVGEAEVAEEIVSDSFVKLWQARDKFYLAEKVKAFLYIVTKNACLNHVRSSHARHELNYEMGEELLSADPEIYDKIIRTELMQSIYEEVSRLPEKQREVFRLTYLDDLNTEEICERLRMTPTAVFANRSRAVKILRNVFKDKDVFFCLLLLQQLIQHSGWRWAN